MSEKMREILFRAKINKTQSEWVEGFYVHIPCGRFMCDEHLIQTIDADGRIGQLYNVYESTLGQFTGLTDKNGKKIFEGDVFKFPDEIFESYCTSCGTEYNSWETENYGVIGFDEDSGRYDFVQYRFSNNAVEADLHENKDIDFADFVKELEVIGNIHDNPELLEDGTNV